MVLSLGCYQILDTSQNVKHFLVVLCLRRLLYAVASLKCCNVNKFPLLLMRFVLAKKNISTNQMICAADVWLSSLAFSLAHHFGQPRTEDFVDLCKSHSNTSAIRFVGRLRWANRALGDQTRHLGGAPLHSGNSVLKILGLF